VAAHVKYDASYIGRVYGRLTVVGLVEPVEGTGNTGCLGFWWTRCECGRRVRSRIRSLVSGQTKSCGMGACKKINRAFISGVRGGLSAGAERKE